MCPYASRAEVTSEEMLTTQAYVARLSRLSLQQIAYVFGDIGVIADVPKKKNGMPL